MWLHADVKSLGDIPRYYARTKGGRTALIGASQRVTFVELNATSNRVSQAIIKAGIAPGAHIGFLGKNSIEYFEAMFGIVKAGCAILPLNWRLNPVELQAVIDDAGLQLIFVDDEYRDLAAGIGANCKHAFKTIGFDSSSAAPTEWQQWLAAASDSDPFLPIDPRTTALLMYTSGTTGKPKGVQITHEGLNYMRLCEYLEPAYHWDDNDIMIFVMPNFHLVGTGLSIQGLYNGITLTILPTADMGCLLDTIERDRPTICCLVPTAIQMLLDHPKAATADLSSLRMVMYAGSPIGLKLLKRALSKINCQFMQFYGSTEASGIVTLLRPEQHDLNDEKKLKSCGTPLPLIEIKIVDDNNVEVLDGEVGEFMLRTPTIFRGYWNQADATAAALNSGWYRTGDAGYRDSEGLLYLVDRVKDMVISGGENIYSTEVEQALVQHPAVEQVAVIGLPDEKWGERVTAVVVPAKNQAVTAEELITHCRTLIAGYKVPKTVIFQAALPMTPSGKILKAALRDQHGNAAKVATTG